MGYLKGVNLLPATGEWAYDSVPYQGMRAGTATLAQLNLAIGGPAGTKTDRDYSLDRLQAQFPGCATVALVVAWFGNSTESSRHARSIRRRPIIGGAFEKCVGGGWLR